MQPTQSPAPDSHLLKWSGDTLEVTLKLERPAKGRAVLRTDIGNAAVSRRETIDFTERAATPLARGWHDIEMAETRPGEFSASVPLREVGIFSAKACFFPADGSAPLWPEGGDLHVKVAPAHTRRANSIYTAYVRQFGAALHENPVNARTKPAMAELDRRGFSVIPPSGTFRNLAAHLDHIMDTMGFRIVQVLPIFPVPTTFARMGRFGSSFAAVDFLSVDPACAEFDKHATPLDQFGELADAIHARGGLLYLDLPANHTGWAATLQTHHPEWYRKEKDGSFHSPGAWGVTWADLVELDYSLPELRAYMADVFLFWCRHGVDGFRCDAGYMIPDATWRYIVARVRDEFPDTVFMLEGLGGDPLVTDNLISNAGLDWAYSETFQTLDRGAFEWYLPKCIEISESRGPLVHFAETHDNDRLAKNGRTWAKLRVAMSALLSQQGAWGMTNGVEWFATEKVDVHGASSLNWGAHENMVDLVARLNRLTAEHPAFGTDTHIEMVQRGEGNFIAVKRTWHEGRALVLLNLDCNAGCNAKWDPKAFPKCTAKDLVTGKSFEADPETGTPLAPGEFLCLETPGDSAWAAKATAKERRRESLDPEPPEACTRWSYPRDLKRRVPVPNDDALAIKSPRPFRAVVTEGGRVLASASSATVHARPEGPYCAVLPPFAYSGDGTACRRLKLEMTVYNPPSPGRTSDAMAEHASGEILICPPGKDARVETFCTPERLRRDKEALAVLSNGAGADSFVRIAWGETLSKYDSLFSANPNPNVPADRLRLWTRCRVWLQHNGYSREVNRDCLANFRVEPDGTAATWFFHVPCGLGKQASFAFTLAHAFFLNSAQLEVKRYKSGKDDTDDEVRLVFRPDVEWCSFHELTKAYAGAEHAYPAGVKTREDGFSFSPYVNGDFTLTSDRAKYTPDAQWCYNVHHEIDAERGQDAEGDLFSPGWFAADFAPGEAMKLEASFRCAGNTPKTRPVPADNSHAEAEDRLCRELERERKPQPVDETLVRSLRLYIQRRDDLSTVLAGYPWFLDWGRDTLIFLRGYMAAGKIEESLAILTAFARFEEKGTIPNIIHGETAGNRDTSDAPLWLIVTTAAVAEKLGTEKVLATDCTPRGSKRSRTLAEVVSSILEHYLAGTPNGIHVDGESGLVWSPTHFTWMDTNYPAGTPRVGYPVEIQALWISALRFAAKAIDAKWGERAEKAAKSLAELFAVPGIGLADCLRAPNGEPAAKAKKEDALRPNQLFAITLGALPASAHALRHEILDACEELLVPGGNRSVADRDTKCDFAVRGSSGQPLNSPHHPYWGSYSGDEDTRRKPAYHNGTIWGWTFPMHAEAMVKTAEADPAATPDSVKRVKTRALSLLASSVENFREGAIAHLSENADGDAPHHQKGSPAQAWSESELLRVWMACK